MKISGLIKPRKKSGFTIIEVMIVLAIAGLIMVVVFYAIPQVQAARRDTQRKTHAGLVVEAMLEYWKNNKKIPFCMGGGGCNGPPLEAAISGGKNLLDNYFPESSDPSTGRSYHQQPAGESGHMVRLPAPQSGGRNMAEYFLNAIHPTNPAEESIKDPDKLLGLVIIAPNYRCSGGAGVISKIGTTSSTAETDKFVVVIKLERGWYCEDNS